MEEQKTLMFDMARWQIWAETYASVMGAQHDSEEAEQAANEAISKFESRFADELTSVKITG